MLTVFVLTVALTAYAVLGDCEKSCEQKYCNLDLAQTLCMENFNLTQADGKLVTMMMMIMTSTMVMVVVMVKMIMVVMVKMIMVVMVMMPMLIVLLMVAMFVMMINAVGCGAADGDAGDSDDDDWNIHDGDDNEKINKKVSPQFVAHEDCLLIETHKMSFMSYNYILFFLPPFFSSFSSGEDI